MRGIAREAAENPQSVINAPHATPVSHPDDTAAAMHPVLTYSRLMSEEK